MLKFDNMKTCFIPLVILSLLFNFCAKQKSTYEKINVYRINLEESINRTETIPLSSIGHSIEYIPLETNSSSLLRNIRQIVFTDSYIFVSDINKLLQFDRKGNFVRQIGSKGRGPGEYTGVWDYCIDELKKLIYIPSSQGGKKLLVFDFNGISKESINLSFKPWSLIQIDTGRLMFYMLNQTHSQSDTAYSWYITKNNGDVLMKYRNLTKRERKPEYVVLESPFYMFKKSAKIMEFGIDTLYSINGLKKEAYTIFNFGKYKLDTDPDILNNELVEEYNKKYWITSIIEDKRNMYVTLVQGLGGPYIPAVFNKQDSSFARLSEGAFKNDIDQGLSFWPSEVLKDSILVGHVQAYKLLETINSRNCTSDSKLGLLRNNITETSNPVLIIVKN